MNPTDRIVGSSRVAPSCRAWHGPDYPTDPIRVGYQGSGRVVDAEPDSTDSRAGAHHG
jgi:hypothetical protein